MSPKVFISYAQEDASQVNTLARRLESAGIHTWMDSKDLRPGDLWERTIEDAIDKSDFFITCLSSTSVDKVGYFQAELKRALNKSKRYPQGRVFILPVLLDNCEVPAEIAFFHYVKITQTGAILELIKTIKSMKGSNIKEVIGEQREPFFTGLYQKKLSNGRAITLPRIILNMIRSYGGNKIILSSLYENCLDLYTYNEYVAVMKKINQMENIEIGISPDSQRQLLRFMMGAAFEITISSSSRIVFPDLILKKYGIKVGDNLLLCGVGARVEIWLMSDWERQIKVSEFDSKMMRDLLNHNIDFNKYR